MKVLIILSLVLALVTAEEPLTLLTDEEPPYNCQQEPDYGTCHGKRTAWFYSMKDHGCLAFIYSGCGGNYNRFSTELSCIDFCISSLDFDIYGIG